MKTKISIITPSLNSFPLLKETCLSILNQKAVVEGNVELEYIICDGGSTDGTVEWVEQYNHPAIALYSEKDRGMYHALARGVEKVTGNIISYLNCGDYYSPYAFDILEDVFSSHPQVKWITGYRTWYNEKGYMVSADLPYRYRKEFIRKGMYGNFLPYIQQESTFWREDLLACIDLEVLSRLKYAGDYYIWHRFAGMADLFVVAAYLGGFRQHAGQLSEDKSKYRAELAEIVRVSPGFSDYFRAVFDKMVWYLPDIVKQKLNPEMILL